MPLFDRYLIVDWSAANTPKRGKDSIWIGLCGSDIETRIENIPTRAAATLFAASQIEQALEKGKRLIAGFDFGFGYPSGAFRSVDDNDSWETMWRMISEGIEDDEQNRSNRFEYASGLNTEIFADVEGPFWGHPHQHAGRYSDLGPKRPHYDKVREKRIVETVVPSAQPLWKLAYTGSVGSQTLLGIARLQTLRLQFSDHIAVWPFETSFANDLSKPVTLAEVYPSIIPVEVYPGEVKDAAQVRTVAEWFRAFDADDELEILFSAPESLSDEQRQIVVQTEGWIVGAGHHAI